MFDAESDTIYLETYGKDHNHEASIKRIKIDAAIARVKAMAIQNQGILPRAAYSDLGNELLALGDYTVSLFLYWHKLI